MTTPDGCICHYEVEPNGIYIRTAHPECKATHSKLEWQDGVDISPDEFVFKQPKNVSKKKIWKYRRERLAALKDWKGWKRDGTLKRIMDNAIRGIEGKFLRGQ